MFLNGSSLIVLMITTIVLDWGGVINLTGHASLISKQIQEKYGLDYMEIIGDLFLR